MISKREIWYYKVQDISMIFSSLWNFLSSCTQRYINNSRIICARGYFTSHAPLAPLQDTLSHRKAIHLLPKSVELGVVLREKYRNVVSMLDRFRRELDRVRKMGHSKEIPKPSAERRLKALGRHSTFGQDARLRLQRFPILPPFNSLQQIQKYPLTF